MSFSFSHPMADGQGCLTSRLPLCSPGVACASWAFLSVVRVWASWWSPSGACQAHQRSPHAPLYRGLGRAGPGVALSSLLAFLTCLVLQTQVLGWNEGCGLAQRSRVGGADPVKAGTPWEGGPGESAGLRSCPVLGPNGWAFVSLPRLVTGDGGPRSPAGLGGPGG